jgi:hypothetical protein
MVAGNGRMRKEQGVAENIMGEGDQHWEVGLEDYMGSMLSIRS